MDFLGKLETFYNVLKKVANNDFFFVGVNNRIESDVFFSSPFFLY